MPSRLKKKRAALAMDASTGEITAAGGDAGKSDGKNPAPVRQIVEVIGDEADTDPIDTIKTDAKEIEEAAAELEERQHKQKTVPPQDEAVAEDDADLRQKATVESLFATETSQTAGEITAVSRSRKSIGVWAGALLGMALAVGLSLVFFVRGSRVLPLVAVVPTPTLTPTAAPSPTAAPALNRKDIKVRVLNGGGTPGAGARLKAYLEEKGYTVTGVGNASDYTFDTTEISVKKGSEGAADLVLEDLMGEYSVASRTGSLEDSASYDIQVIVGKE